MGKGYALEKLLSALCLIAIASPALHAACASPAAAHPPAHANHTLVERYFRVNYLLLRIVSVGDVIGDRQIIVWLELQNNANYNWSIHLGNMRARVPGGEWRQCYRTCWSNPSETHVCEAFERQVWSHPAHAMGPRSSATAWVIFELSKFEFDSMNQLEIQWPTPEGEVSATLAISPGRKPEYVPYVEMLRPLQGGRLAWLGSVKFLVLDLDSRPVNWTVELDGTFYFEGRADPRFDRCPIVVEANLGGRELSSGQHRLLVRATSGRVSETVSVDFVLQPTAAQLELEWAINTSDILAGKTFGAGHQGCQTVWDIDGDGTNEIIFATRRGDSRRLWCFDANQNLEWIYPPIDRDGLPGDPTSKVSLVDVNKDGKFELCLGGRGGRLHVLNPDGSILWTWDNPNVGSAIPGSPQALDVDGDGNVEFFLVDETGSVHRVSHEGELIWTSPKATGTGTGQPTVCDLDLDGRYEVVWSEHHRNIYCTDAQTGNHKWIFEAYCNPPVIVADVNRDDRYEVVAWTEHSPEGAVLIVGPDGAEISRWTGASPGWIRLCQAMGDVDGDGSMDLAVMSETAIFCVDIGQPTPVTKWMINVTDWAAKGLIPDGAVCSAYSSYQLIADIDGDDEQEILWLVPYPMVTDAATGRLEAYYINEHIQVGARAENGGWWGDVDGDGRSEWIVELNGKSHPQTLVYCLTLNGKFPADAYWPEYYHSAHPAEFQNQQDWLRLKSAYSNSLWFPMPETLIQSTAAMACLAILYGAGRLPQRSRR